MTPIVDTPLPEAPWVQRLYGEHHTWITCANCYRSVHAGQGHDLPRKEVERFVAVHRRCGFVARAKGGGSSCP